jgi:hypothetical protein
MHWYFWLQVSIVMVTCVVAIYSLVLSIALTVFFSAVRHVHKDSPHWVRIGHMQRYLPYIRSRRDTAMIRIAVCVCIASLALATM